MTCVSTNREPQSGGLPIHAAPARRGTPHRQGPHPSTETRTPASADRRHPSRQRRWAGTRAPVSPTAGTLGGGDSAAAGVRVHPAPRSQAHRDSGASEDLTSRSTTGTRRSPGDAPGASSGGGSSNGSGGIWVGGSADRDVELGASDADEPAVRAHHRWGGRS